MDEIRKHFPLLWNEIDNFRTKMMFGNITKVIDQGKAEGLFIDYRSNNNEYAGFFSKTGC